MPFPSQVIVTLQNEESFSCPPKNFREKMTGEMFFQGLEHDIWADLERSLWASVQRLPLFKQEKLIRKIGKFTFKVFLSQRPEVWPR